MPRRIQTAASRFNSKTIATLGDSYSYNAQFNTLAADFFPHQVAKAIRALGGIARSRNFGVAGNTTGQMVARMACLTQFEVPSLVILYGGQNDTNFATTVASASSGTVFTVQAGLGVSYGAGSYVQVNGVSRQILSVATDTITLATTLGFTPTAGQSVINDTQVNLQLIVAFSIAAGCTRNIIVGRHYDNFSASQGDTLATPGAVHAAMRVLQQAAATASGAIYSDSYAYFRNLIVAGTETQGSFSWHVADLNGHLNALGELYLARCVTATIQAQSGWVAALS